MKKLVCIFAHPDDESFGPGGTLATFAQKQEVSIICVTSGDAAGEGTVREKELEQAAKILCVKKVFYLRYPDGGLNNGTYHTIAAGVQQILDDIQPETILTFEMRGVSGHIDHITVSMISSYLFDRLLYIQEIWYYCLGLAHRKLLENYFIYVPPGYSESEIDESIDISEVWNLKEKAMKCHKSQQHDVDRLLARFKKLEKKEYFLVRRR